MFVCDTSINFHPLSRGNRSRRETQTSLYPAALFSSSWGMHAIQHCANVLSHNWFLFILFSRIYSEVVLSNSSWHFLKDLQSSLNNGNFFILFQSSSCTWPFSKECVCLQSHFTMKAMSLRNRNKSSKDLTQDLGDASGPSVDPCTDHWSFIRNCLHGRVAVKKPF